MKRVPYFILASALIILAGYINLNTTKPIVKISGQDSNINLHHNILQFVSLGNKRMIADLIWIATLMESDEVHYQGKDFNSWMYLRFLSIAYLDPLFFQNYLWGGIYLSVIKDDPLGGPDLLERGLKKFPDNYDLNYYQGFNYLYEFDNNAEAYKYLSRIQNHPKSKELIKSIINKLRYAATHDYGITMNFLKETYNSSTDELIKNKIKADIYALKAEHDLECLNSGKRDCEKQDLDGINYLIKDGRWIAAKTFQSYKLHRKKKN